jgi:TolA-binding protein
MKRTERHHLKENDFAEWLFGAKAWYEGNRSLVVYGGMAIALVAIAVTATLVFRQISAGAADRMLAEALIVAESPVMPPATAEPGKAPMQPPGTYPNERTRLEAALPRLLAVAETYPSGAAGIMARYRAASALASLGRTAEAVARYREITEKTTGLYQVVSRLGIADAQLAAGQFDQAIASLKEMSQAKPDDAPLDGVLMQLGRAYRLAGKPDDAARTFKRVTDEFPQSTYATQARREIDTMEGGKPATR